MKNKLLLSFALALGSISSIFGMQPVTEALLPTIITGNTHDLTHFLVAANAHIEQTMAAYNRPAADGKSKLAQLRDENRVEAIAGYLLTHDKVGVTYENAELQRYATPADIILRQIKDGEFAMVASSDKSSRIEVSTQDHEIIKRFTAEQVALLTTLYRTKDIPNSNILSINESMLFHRFEPAVQALLRQHYGLKVIPANILEEIQKVSIPQRLLINRLITQKKSNTNYAYNYPEEEFRLLGRNIHTYLFNHLQITIAPPADAPQAAVSIDSSAERIKRLLRIPGQIKQAVLGHYRAAKTYFTNPENKRSIVEACTTAFGLYLGYRILRAKIQDYRKPPLRACKQP